MQLYSIIQVLPHTDSVIDKNRNGRSLIAVVSNTTLYILKTCAEEDRAKYALPTFSVFFLKLHTQAQYLLNQLNVEQSTKKKKRQHADFMI